MIKLLVDTFLKFLAVTFLGLLSMGCSVMSLQCGTDGNSSFVNLNTSPKVWRLIWEQWLKDLEKENAT